MKRDRLICLGVFGAPHGVRGAIKLRTYTAAPENAAAYGPVTTKDQRRRFNLTVVRPLKGDMAIVTAPEIDNREDARSLTGVEVYIARDRLPDTQDEDEFYHEDLVGLRVVTDAGLPAGIVGAVHNFGAGDLLEIKGVPRRSGSMLIPFTRALAPCVNIEGGRIIIAAAAFEEDHDDSERMAPQVFDEDGQLMSEDAAVTVEAMRAEDA